VAYGIVAMAVPALGQATADRPEEVNVCDVARNATKHDGKMIRVRSRVSIAFEDFKLSTDQCDEPKIRGIWLEYGRGPKKQPTTWCCGDITPQDRLVLVQDADFLRFDRYLTEQRRDPGCYEGQCYVYDVTATIIGRLDTAKAEACPSGKGLCCTGGFGHFGFSCARLVIHQVSGISVERKVAPAR
jgi:hypothetical protein